MPFLSRVVLAGLTLAAVGASLVRTRRSLQQRIHDPHRDGDVLVMADGARAPLALWAAEEPPRAIILGLHAYGDYRRSFRLAGPWFAARGLSFYAFDQRGFGDTASRGTWPGAEALLLDLADAVAVIRGEHPDLPLILLGESMGGTVALAALASGELGGVDQLILAAPAFRGDMPLRQLHDVVLRLASLALPWLAVELRRGGRPWLEAGEAARLADDPLIMRELSVGTYEGLIELTNLASSALRGMLPPTLLLYGELDGTIPRRAINDLAQRLDGRDKIQIYPDRHHLLLHEHHAEGLFADCLTWLTSDGKLAPCN